jgi:uncharacterized NAD-dependent epimerase/dehydratase family protein
MRQRLRRVAILADGTLDFHHGKTAISLLRYRPQDVVAVIDREHAGATTEAVLGLGGQIPIVPDVARALAFGPTVLLIGIAPRGGGLPSGWRRQILVAVAHRLDVVSGLHYMLGDDAEIRAAALHHDVRLVDVRRTPDNLSVAELAPRRSDSRVITFVGSDCAVGKMTAALEVTAAARRLGQSAAFVATGQTGIMLEGSGIAIDRVIGDFMAGATERLVLDASSVADWVFVEGQGSLLHPGYSGVTLALLHGSAPDGLILVHQVGHDRIDGYPVSIPPLDRLVQIYEEAASWVRPAPVLGIALNARGLSRGDARAAVAQAELATGLPTTDPVQFGGEKLARAVIERLQRTPAVPLPGAPIEC